MYLELTILFASSLLLGKLTETLSSNKKRRSYEQIQKKENVQRPKAERKEILYQGMYYDVTEFISRHPGGSIINFYVNNEEDATNAVQQFHFRSKEKVQLMLKGFKRRPAVLKDHLGEKESLRYQELSKDFQELHTELVKEGYFQPSYLRVALRLVELVGFFVGSYFVFRSGGPIGKVLATIAVGVGGGRYGWYMHEGGHYSLTGNPKVDRFLQEFAMCLGLGMSASWWRSQHNRHHAMPQRLKHDVDLDTVPFFASNFKLLTDPKKQSNFLLRNQIYFFVPLGSVALFLNWILNLHPRYAWKKSKYRELVLMGAHWYILTTFAGLVPVFFAHMIGAAIMLLNFALSHSHLPVTEEPRHWVEYSLSHTVDIEASWLVDWWMGYLNYQIEHHLFPTMPQFRQRQIRHRVRALAEKHGLPYVCLSYTVAVAKTYRNLIDVSRQLSQ